LNPQGWEAIEALPECSRVCKSFFDVLKNENKTKQRMKREEYDEIRRSGKHRKIVFVNFVCISKIK